MDVSMLESRLSKDEMVIQGCVDNIEDLKEIVSKMTEILSTLTDAMAKAHVIE